jgi:hypothetical protein
MKDSNRRGASDRVDDRNSPKLLTVQEVNPLIGKPGEYQITLPPVSDGECTLLVECDAHEFPFQSYCRYVRHAGENLPYTFSSMEFHERGPGIRLGPWPGWRGIPEWPVASASCGGKETRLQPTFWGDEIARGIVRLVGNLPAEVSGNTIIATGELSIVPTRVSIYHTHQLKAKRIPASLLPELRDVHPRLLVREDQLPSLRAKVSASHRTIWLKLLGLWENRHLPFEKTPESKCVSGPQRLAEEDRVVISALFALVTEKREDTHAALEAYARYMDVTRRADFEPLRIDTQSGEVLFTLCLGYDWLFRWMTESDKTAAWNEIERVAAICASFLGPERRDYGQAHYLGCGLGLLAYAFLLPDERLDRGDRIAELRGSLDCALTLLATDGSYPHGINLWIYEFSFLLRWIELFRGCAGLDVWSTAGYALERASGFRAATLSSDAMKGISFGDPQYRVGGDSWCHFLIASRTRSGIAQWLGLRLQDLTHDGVDFRNIPPRRRVYEILFYDPDVDPAPPEERLQTFEEVGQITARSNGTLFTMRSGPPLGRRRYAAGEYGAYGHSDPANGSFLIERNGVLIASGPGPVYRRDTALHNVITIDGQGQVGDSTVWLPDFFPPEVLPHTPRVDVKSLTADLTRAYLPCLGIKQYVRAIYANPARVVAGVDTIVSGLPHRVEWNVHSHLPFCCMSAANPLRFDLGSDVRLIVFAPANASWETSRSEFVPAYPNDGTRDYRCVVSVNAPDAQFFWLYLLAGQSIPALRRGGSGSFAAEFVEGDQLLFDGTLLVLRGAR